MVPHEDGRVSLVVGDVMGRGVETAARRLVCRPAPLAALVTGLVEALAPDESGDDVSVLAARRA